MATIAERMAALETRVTDNGERLGRLHDLIHGGPTCEWKQSVRGRLHDMKSAVEAADKLAEATQALVREQNRLAQERGRLRQTRFKTWQWVVAAALAFATAAAPYVALYVHVSGR